MATKRIPIHRGARVRINPQAIDAWRVLRQHQGMWDRHHKAIDATCGLAPGATCPACLAYLDAFHALARACGVRPWQDHPIDAARYRDAPDLQALAAALDNAIGWQPERA
jgi:hypothetical protein